MSLLSFEDGVVRLGSTELPGIMTRITISGRFRSDDKVHDQLSGTVRIPLGWDDADIRLQMDLTTENEGKTCYEKLEVIDRLFKSTDKDGNPFIYQIVNRHVLARGIHKVSFDRLRSVENDQSDTISIVLDFREFIPAIVQIEENAARRGADSSIGLPATSATEPAADPAIFND